MEIIKFVALEGRNIYSHRQCIRLDVDLEGYAEVPSYKIEGLSDKLLKWIPELYSHRCGIDEEGGFVKRLREGTYLAHICEHSILALQNRLGIEVAYGKAREIQGEKYYIIYEYKYKNTGIEIGRTAVDIINAILNKKTFNLELRLQEIKEILRKEQLGPSTLAIYEAAKKRGIPVKRIGEGSLLHLGYGKYGKFVEATISNTTTCIGADIASDKLLTKELLHNQCIPVAVGGRVRNSIELLLEAESIGYPVVLKPRYGNQGKGVIVNIKNEKEAIKAYEKLKKEYDEIIIEKYVEGRDYRVCIIDGEVVAIAERIPPAIIGDGHHNVEFLIEGLNKDSRRGEGHEKALTKIKVDQELLHCIGREGFDMESVLPKGYKLNLRRNANLSTGGVAIDCTEIICAENIELCKRVSKTVGLDVCGIDVCAMDISKPIEGNGVIIEVNAAPGIRMHHYPFVGESRDVAGAMVDMIFKDTPKTIPIVSVTGTNGKTTTTRLISHVLMIAGYNVGMTTTGGIYINGKCIDKGDTTGARSAFTVLLNKEIDAAVLETARGGLIRQGLAYDLADVGVITNITEDHLGIDGIETVEELAHVKALVGEAVKENGYVVLNADDKMSMCIKDRIKSPVIFFTKNKNTPFVKEHISKGGFLVYSEGGYIYLEKPGETLPLVRVEDIGITLNGKLMYNIENAMAACAALVGLGVEVDIIKKGITSFYSDEKQNPGRFNIYSFEDITVVLDYGHNIEGYKAVLEGAEKLDHQRFIGIIGAPGDRLDSNIRELGKISAQYFDFIYIKEDEDRRGRRVGETATILQSGVFLSDFSQANLEIVLDEKEALKRAIEKARPGDLIIIFFEKYEPLLEIIEETIKKQKQISI